MSAGPPGAIVARAHRLVVKVGSSLVTGNGRGIDHAAVGRWAEEIAALKAAGRELLLVSSGAIAEGMQRLGWAKRPAAIHALQAAAAVGQMGLVQAYETAFARFELHTAQILLTHEDLADRRRYLNARSTLLTLLGLGVIPIINENDTVTTDEIRLGDNDTLGALVTNLVEADVLLLLTDQDGLYDADPRKDPAAKLVHRAQAGDPRLEAFASGAGSGLGRGGMLTKVLAAKRAARSGATTIIANGRADQVLTRLAAGEAIGTELVAETLTLAARKQWAPCARSLAKARVCCPSASPLAKVSSSAARSSAAATRRGARSRAGWSITAQRRRSASCASHHLRSRRSWVTSTSRSLSTATTWCCSTEA